MADNASWRPSVSNDTLIELAAIRRRVRNFFDARGVLDVQTPCLGRHTVTDPCIESLTVELGEPAGRRYLQTSPEYYMKRLLAAGAGDIYQVCPVFRAGEAGRRHQPEFTLIEWYRHGSDLDAIVDDTTAMIAAATAGSRPVHRIRYAEAFADVLSIDVLTASDNSLLEQLGDDAPAGLVTRDSVLDWLFVRHVAPSFTEDALTVLTHYPASQAALARLDPADPRTALRFEVFAGALELGNGFVELTDSREQADRFARDREQRARAAQAVPAADDALLAALAHGLPDCAGVAVGFERLAMLALNTGDIRDVMAFAPVTDQTGNRER